MKPSRGEKALLFTPESAAKLVSALVRSFHGDEGNIGRGVGPGWRITDDPLSPAALFGGSFDDAAFTTERRPLAEGGRICGAITGAGNLIRPSFRDPPQPMPAHLIVEPPPAEPPQDPFIVSDLTIHPLSAGEWALQCGDSVLNSGPEELIRKCVAGIGPSRLSNAGVLTPALLFEGLQIGG
jgi:hypothetical protein